MGTNLKLDTPPRTLVTVSLDRDLVRAGKAFALKRGVPFTKIVGRALRHYLRQEAEAEVEDEPGR